MRACIAPARALDSEMCSNSLNSLFVQQYFKKSGLAAEEEYTVGMQSHQ